jgi:hypothetical protein
MLLAIMDIRAHPFCTIHFASDSRLSLGVAAADIAIKVVRAPYRISGQRDQGGPPEIIAQGELGMCFAGSASGSMFMKEAIIEVLPYLVAAPGYTDISMANVAALVFRAYRAMSRTLTEQIGNRGLSTVSIAGYCPEQKKLRAFKLTTNQQNEASSTVLPSDQPPQLKPTKIVATAPTAAPCSRRFSDSP